MDNNQTAVTFKLKLVICQINQYFALIKIYYFGELVSI